jgi:predicted phosphodiesterase
MNKKIFYMFSLLLLVCLIITGCPPPALLFDVGEMVGNVSSSSANVFVQVGSLVTPTYEFKMGYDSVSHAIVRNYPRATIIQSSAVIGNKITFTIASGLNASTCYYYAIAYRASSQSAWVWRPEQSFNTIKSVGSGFRFCVVSDAHGAGTYQEQNLKGKIAKNIQADKPDFILMLGDILPLSVQGCGNPVVCTTAYMGVAADGYATYALQQYKTLAYFLSPIAASSLLVWVNGNHEGLAGYLQGCPHYAGILTARKKFLPLLDIDELNGFYGDLVWGDIHIIWIDSLAFTISDPYALNDPKAYALGTTQKTWLETTLATSTSKFKFIFSHTLFGGAGPNFPCTPGKSYARGNANFVNTPGTDQIYIQSLMKTYGVQAFCYGHDHTYSVSELDGIKYITVGSMYPSYWSACLDPYYAPWSTINQVGHLRIDVGVDKVETRYIKAALDISNGTVLDTQEIGQRSN